MTLSLGEIQAIVRGDHGDAVLGPRRVSLDGTPAVAVRAVLPAAVTARVVPVDAGIDPRPMERVHSDGLLEAVFPGLATPFPYRLAVVDGRGRPRRSRTRTASRRPSATSTSIGHFAPMGGEFGQIREWNHDRSLDWYLLDLGPYHKGLQRLVQHLNRVYRTEPALHEVDDGPAGFEWIDCSDWEQSVVSFIRWSRGYAECVVVVCNFTPVPRYAYRVGVPRPGYYRELVNTDSVLYGGSNHGNAGGAWAEPLLWQGRPHSVVLTLPPLSTLLLKPASG